MLPKMKQSHFVKKYSVQFVNANGKLSAPFYFWDNKPHECSQTWQVVRSEFDQMMLDNAREHGVDVHEGVRVLDVLFEGERAVGVRIKHEDGDDRATCARKVVVDASGQNGLMHEPAPAARLGSGAQQGRHLDLLGRRLPRHRPRRRRDARHPDAVSKKGWFWYIPLHNNIVSVGVVAPFDYLFKGRGGLRRRRTTKKSSACPGGEGARRDGQRDHRLLRHQGLLVPLDAGRRRRLGAGRRRLRLPRSAVLVGRAAGAASPANWPPTPICEGFAKGDTSAAQLGTWGAAFNEGVDRMRRLVCEYYDGFSFGHFVRNYPRPAGHGHRPAHRRSVHRRASTRCGQPMESLYPPGKPPIPPWNAGVAADQATDKANELVLPDGRRPLSRNVRTSRSSER